jgi:hypothetical protein
LIPLQVQRKVTLVQSCFEAFSVRFIEDLTDKVTKHRMHSKLLVERDDSLDLIHSLSLLQLLKQFVEQALPEQGVLF